MLVKQTMRKFWMLLIVMSLVVHHAYAYEFQDEPMTDDIERRIVTPDDDSSAASASMFSVGAVKSFDEHSIRSKMPSIKVDGQGRRGTCSVFSAIALFEYQLGGQFSEQC